MIDTATVQREDPLDFSPRPITRVSDGKAKYKIHHSKNGDPICGGGFNGRCVDWAVTDMEITCKRCAALWEKEFPKAQITIQTR